MAPCQSIKALTTITLRLKGRNDKTICILAMQIAFLMVMKGSVLIASFRSYWCRIGFKRVGQGSAEARIRAGN